MDSSDIQQETVTICRKEDAGVRITSVLQITALLAPLLAIYTALGIATLLAFCAILILAISLYEKKRLSIALQQMALPLVLLLLWGGLSAFWAVSSLGALKTLAQLVGLFAVGLIVIGSARRLNGPEATRVQRMLVLGIAMALVIYGVEIWFHAPIQALLRNTGADPEAMYSPFNRGLAVLALVIPPATIALRRSGYPTSAAIMLLVGVIIVFAYFGTSIQVAVLAGIFAALFAAARPAIIRWLGICAASLIVAAPLVASLVLTQTLIATAGRQTENVSGPHRLVIWRFVAERIRQRPSIGWGLDSARVMPGGKDKVPLALKNDRHPHLVERLPLHPHNFALQWWLELGAPGALLGASFVALVFSAIAILPTDRVEKAALTGQTTTALGIYGLGYGAWQSWWLAALILAATFSRIAVLVPARTRTRETRPL